MYIFYFPVNQYVDIITIHCPVLYTFLTLFYAFSTILIESTAFLPSFLRFYIIIQQFSLIVFWVLSPLMRRNAHNFLKIPVKSRQCGESRSHCNISYGIIGFFQFVTCRLYPYPIYVFHRRHIHAF